MTHIYAVYTEYYGYKYQPVLDSLWTTEALATQRVLDQAERWQWPDSIYVQKLKLDSDDLYNVNEETQGG